MASKSDFINDFASELDVSKKDAARVASAIEAIIKRQLDNEGEALIPGIGKLKLVKRSARKGRNPATGEVMEIPEKTVVKATLFKSLAG